VRLSILPTLLALSVAPSALEACAVAFQSGAGEAPAPSKFHDSDTSIAHEQEKEESVTTHSTPTFGMSLVVGGVPLDAGSLPKPPIPVVMLPHEE
jgi:hypothetical protein